MKSQLQDLLRAAVATVIEGSAAPMPRDILVEPAKDKKNGDFASNVAMMLAKPLGKPPRAVAEAIVAALPRGGIIDKIEIAGPGFINFFLAAGALQQVVVDILNAGDAFGIDRSGTKGKAMVEFVSANPTGPLHVGHGRGAAVGDCMARVLAAAGWQVTKEFYYNDAGNQIANLGVSVQAVNDTLNDAHHRTTPKKASPRKDELT